MATNVKVTAGSKKNNLAVLREFRNLVNKFGAARVIRKRRYFKRTESDYVKKSSRLRVIERTKERDRQIKLGRVAPRS